MAIDSICIWQCVALFALARRPAKPLEMLNIA
jgi:hypothetical protein